VLWSLRGADWSCDNALVAAHNAAIEITTCGAGGGLDTAGLARKPLRASRPWRTRRSDAGRQWAPTGGGRRSTAYRGPVGGGEVDLPGPWGSRRRSWRRGRGCSGSRRRIRCRAWCGGCPGR
jgi:hypothetical protein